MAYPDKLLAVIALASIGAIIFDRNRLRAVAIIGTIFALLMATGYFPPRHWGATAASSELRQKPAAAQPAKEMDDPEEPKNETESAPDIEKPDGDIPRREGPTPAELNYRRHLERCPRQPGPPPRPLRAGEPVPAWDCPPVPVEIATDDARAKARAQQAQLKFLCWEYSDEGGGNHLLSQTPITQEQCRALRVRVGVKPDGTAPDFRIVRGQRARVAAEGRVTARGASCSRGGCPYPGGGE